MPSFDGLALATADATHPIERYAARHPIFAAWSAAFCTDAPKGEEETLVTPPPAGAAPSPKLRFGVFLRTAAKGALCSPRKRGEVSRTRATIQLKAIAPNRSDARSSQRVPAPGDPTSGRSPGSCAPARIFGLGPGGRGRRGRAASAWPRP